MSRFTGERHDPRDQCEINEVARDDREERHIERKRGKPAVYLFFHELMHVQHANGIDRTLPCSFMAKAADFSLFIAAKSRFDACRAYRLC